MGLAFIYFLIALIASIFGSLAGLGGGVIIKPLLDLHGRFDAATVTILSAATVFSMSVIALINFIRLQMKIKIKTSLFIAIGSVCGGIIGKFLFLYILKQGGSSDNVIFIQSIAIFVLLVMIFVLVNHRSKIPTYQLRNPAIIISIGFILGLIAAFLGVGGGPFNVAVLALLFSMNVKESAINSVFIIFFSQLASLLFTASTTGFAHVNSFILMMMIVGGLVGGFIGSKIADHMTNRVVEKVFHAGILLIIAISFINIITYFPR